MTEPSGDRTIDLTDDHRTSRPLRPRPKRPLFMRDLVFTPAKSVQWFRPKVALVAGYRALAASELGMFLDKREIQANQPQPIFDASTGYDELWFDHVADTGDGFDGTYTVLSALASTSLTVERSDGTSAELPRSDLLVLGGDEVYPTASVAEYERRLIGPLLSAFPWTDADKPPRLFAIPGNHDWYDGLTAFLRNFAKPGRSIGAWQVEQSRSYFAIEMPHGWKLWGIDISLGNFVDGPQLDYFAGVPLAEGDRVVIATPVPAWVKEATSAPKTDEDHHRRVGDDLRFFERRHLGSSKAKLAATISGDLHHYARYESVPPDESTSESPAEPIQRITAGGGGAFLYPTHQLPESLEFDDPKSREPLQHDLAARYPDAKTSRRLALFANGGPLAVLTRNRGLWMLTMCLALLLSGVLVGTIAWWSGTSYLWDAGFLQLVMHSVLPPSLFLTLGMFAAGWALADPPPSARRRSATRLVMAGAHGLAQIAAIIGVLWLTLNLLPELDLTPVAADASAPGTDGRTALWITILLGIVTAVGGIAMALVLGLYLTISNGFFGGDPNLAFSAKRIDDYKCFLRCHVTRAGDLEIWPLAIDRANRDWAISDSSDARDPWLVSRDHPNPTVRLIEDPIVIKGGRRPVVENQHSSV